VASILETPTIAAFEQRLGPPLLTFTPEQRQLTIPQGLLACCRVTHQSYCQHYVAKTLIGCEFDIRLPDGEIDQRRPAKQTFDGDVLVRPLEFAAAVQSVAILAESTAAGDGGVLLRLEFSVWTLDLELAAVWDHLLKQQDAQYQASLERADKHSTAWIEALPVVTLEADRLHAIAEVMGQTEFKHVRAYARRVIVLPNEIGHDDEARYITSILGGTADAVPAAVEAIRAGPQEDDDDGFA
jgi:hypothetical protein